jgi:HK97 family phage prohead protease
MRIEIRDDSVILDGYVNAVERFSKPIPSLRGKFVEQIEARAFDRALDKAPNVDLLLNHDTNKKLGSTNEGNLQLFEDNIGLRAICTVTDPDVIQKAKNNELRGWSFGFYSVKDEWRAMKDCQGMKGCPGLDNCKDSADCQGAECCQGQKCCQCDNCSMQCRTVKELDLFEVSIIDNTKNPAYSATSIEMRGDKEVMTENRCNDFKAITIDESSKAPDLEERTDPEPVNYSIYESEIQLLKLKAFK